MELPPDGSWRARASCRSHDPSLFFGGESTSTTSSLQQARAICAGCPVKADCLDYALQTGPRYGIWGGLTQDELQPLRRRRRLRSAS
ncbi:MAG: WhiB family transcriptional regulator [Acidimicrobiia bacterium]|nr:WhiB family transcriptional regulator [Acidimicrobiia bacterium]